MSAGLKYCIGVTIDGGQLSRAEAAAAMGTIMDGSASDAQIGGYLSALRMRGDRPEELLGFLDAFRDRARRIRLDDPDAVDLCGTGGDGLGTFNVSTVAAFVLAGTGVTVAKHGNRSVSSASGSADVLRELGVNIDADPETMEACINGIGVGFLFAPIYHPAMKYVSRARAELGIRTCFNLLGPLANPAGVRRQVVGTFSGSTAETLASILSGMRPAAAMVLHAGDGLDEVSPQSPTQIIEIRESHPDRRYVIDPPTFGLSPVPGLDVVAGGTPARNASIAREILSGIPGPAREFVLMNAALGLMVSREGLDHRDAYARCAESIDSGRAAESLRRLAEATNR